MNNQLSTTIELLGKIYPIRCAEEEMKSLQLAAEYLNKKMLEIKESGKAINPERIAIMAALNIAHALLQINQNNVSFINKVNERITSLQDKLDTAIHKPQQTELLYTLDEA